MDQPSGGGFFARVFGANFNRIEPSWGERQALSLASPPITDRLSQKYLCWRRAMLWTAFGLLTLSTVEETVNTVIQFSNQSEEAPLSTGFFVILWLYYLVKLGACAITAIAAVNWASFTTSARMARLGWLVLFGLIFLQVAVPLVAFVDYASMEKELGGPIPPENKARMDAVIGTIAALASFVYLVPAAFAILPGLVRASLALKTLFPQSTGPGWLLVVVVPIYCAWRLAFALSAHQLGVFPLLGLGAVVFALGPAAFLFYPALRKRLGREEAGQVVTRARVAAIICVAAGLILILLFLAVHQRQISGFIDGFELLIQRFNPNYRFELAPLLWSVAKFVLHIIAVATAVAVVAADCYVSAMARGRALMEDPRERQLAEQFDAELAGMKELAQLRQR